jgi:hypothetical protein
MKVEVKPLRLLCLVMVLGLTFASARAVGAQDLDTTITIHLAECPAGYAGNDPFTDCHENRLAGVIFEWAVAAPGAPETVTTDGDGTAVIETSAAAIDTLGLSITEYPPFDLASFSVYCSKDDGATSVPVNYLSGDVGIAFPTSSDVGDGAIVCDWYNVPVAADSGSGDDDDEEVPTTLPSTGVAPMSGGIGGELWIALASIIAGGMALRLRRAGLNPRATTTNPADAG